MSVNASGNKLVSSGADHGLMYIISIDICKYTFDKPQHHEKRGASRPLRMLHQSLTSLQGPVFQRQSAGSVWQACWSAGRSSWSHSSLLSAVVTPFPERTQCTERVRFPVRPHSAGHGDHGPVHHLRSGSEDRGHRSGGEHRSGSNYRGHR